METHLKLQIDGRTLQSDYAASTFKHRHVSKSSSDTTSTQKANETDETVALIIIFTILGILIICAVVAVFLVSLDIHSLVRMGVNISVEAVFVYILWASVIDATFAQFEIFTMVANLDQMVEIFDLIWNHVMSYELAKSLCFKTLNRHPIPHKPLVNALESNGNCKW